jgi:hypothetical protein
VIDLDRRAKAAQKTLDAFRLRPYKLGRNDCVRMALFHLRAIGKRIEGLKIGPYKTLAQAKAELKKQGGATIGAVLDKHLERIPMAFALTGDLVEFEGERGLTGIGVWLGNGRMCGYHVGIPDGSADVLQPNKVFDAWRVS